MTRRLTLEIAPAHAGQRLDRVLAELLPRALGQPVSKSAVRRLILAGVVRDRGRPLRGPAEPLRSGQRLELRIHLEALAAATPSDVHFDLTASDVLYQDEWLIAVGKPPGLPMHATADPNRPNLVASVQRFLARREGLPPGEGRYLGVHQRLDRDTSGVVLLVKDPVANAGLAALFERRALTKTYHALVLRPPRLPPAHWQARDPVGPPGAEREATTELWLREAYARALLVEARPLTGRKHQVRVHLARAGLPILGDARYGPAGAARPSAPRTLLHALRLELPHPVTGDALRIECPYPEDFRRALEAARLGDQGSASKRQGPGRVGRARARRRAAR